MITLWDILGPIPVGVFGQRDKSFWSGGGILLSVSVITIERGEKRTGSEIHTFI